MIFDQLIEEMEPAIWLRSSDHHVFAGKLGGKPNLPDEIKWPRHHSLGTPLHLLAMIDLSKLPTTPLEDGLALPELPAKGYLHFFADIDETMSWDNHMRGSATRVIFTKTLGNQRLAPDDLPKIGYSSYETDTKTSKGKFFLPEIKLKPHTISTFGGIVPFPPPNDAYAALAEAEMVASMEKAIGSKFPTYEDPASWKAIEAENPKEYIQIRHFRDRNDPNKKEIRHQLNCPRHQILGVGKNIQGMAEEMHQEGTVLLLQIDTSDAKAGLGCWGAIQFWIKSADLTSCRFEQAWPSIECD